MLFCETHDLVWEIVSVSEKRMKNCIVKIIYNVFQKMTKVGLFPLKKGPKSRECERLRVKFQKPVGLIEYRWWTLSNTWGIPRHINHP